MWGPSRARVGQTFRVTDDERLGGVLAALAVVRFLAELGLLAALGYAGWQLSESTALSVVLAVGLPLAAALVWGKWVAPRARGRLEDPARFVVELVLFAAAFGGLLWVGPEPAVSIAGLALWAAYLVSIPVRRRGM